MNKARLIVAGYFDREIWRFPIWFGDKPLFVNVYLPGSVAVLLRLSSKKCVNNITLLQNCVTQLG